VLLSVSWADAVGKVPK